MVKKEKRKVGLHLRLTDTLSEVLEKAIRLQTPIMQCFLITQSGQRYAEFSEEEIKKCHELRQHVGAMYLHASYWVNLAGCNRNGWRNFQKELELGKKLGFSHIIIHPGSATGCENKEQGIDYLARALNKALTTETDIKIVLENTAHARRTVGGNLNDFKQLLELIDQPDRIGFCLDTAHAHSYGYDVITPNGQDVFLNQVANTIGKERIDLLHINETQEKCGSYIDKHAGFGDGKIGNDALKRFMNHPVCKDVPVILEIPLMENEEDERAVLQEITAWNE